MTKYIFVTGGVVSSLGKGITASSIGRLLKNRGLKVTMQKFDPYINIDPGTMNPYQHGEVFVTDDGTEADLDLGHYERLVDVRTSKYSNVTTGKIYQEVLQRERRGDYHGGTVQVIPHVTNMIKEKVMRAAQMTDTDVVISEIGGTVGDMESTPFMEAIRQMRREVGSENVMYVHVTFGSLPAGSQGTEEQADPAVSFHAAVNRDPAKHAGSSLRNASSAGNEGQDLHFHRRSSRLHRGIFGRAISV